MDSGSQTQIRYSEILSRRLPPAAFQPVPSRAFWIPIQVIIVASCTFAIVNLRPNIIASLLLSFIIGFFFCSQGILAHEILHGSVVEGSRLRRLLGTICLAPLMIGPIFWMTWHNTHHAHTQHPQRDPDIWGSTNTVPFDRSIGLLRRFINPRSLLFPLLLCTGVTGHATALLFAMQPQMSPRQRVVTLAEFFAPLIFWITLGFRLGWLHFLFFYVLPLLIANFIVNCFVVTNHFLNPLNETGDPLSGSLTVNCSRWVERLFFNFNYHAEHHLLPGLSSKYAPQVAELLKELWPERYHHLPHAQALLAVWQTPRVYLDEVQLIDLRDHSLYGTLGHGLDSSSVSPRLKAQDSQGAATNQEI